MNDINNFPAANAIWLHAADYSSETFILTWEKVVVRD